VSSKGKYNGQHLPFGLRIDEDRRFAIDEKAAPLVLGMFRMYDEGKPLKQIADWLNSKGVKSSYGNSISVNSLTTMLHNRKYIGEYRHCGTVNYDAIPRDLIKAWLLHFRDTDPDVHEQRQRLVDTFVNSIYVFDDRIVITFNYHDKSRTIKLSDIRGSSLVDSAPPPICQVHDKYF
jgi:hypothetical protein